MKKYLFLLFGILSLCPAWAQIVVDDDEYTNEPPAANLMPGYADSLSALPTDSLPWPLNVQARIDSLLQQPMFQTSTVGIMVYDLTADSTLFVHNHRQLLRPASTMKLLTAITAIDRLGSDYQLHTSLYYKGSIENHTLYGDLYCMGGMDPCFNADDLRAFIDALRLMGIDSLCGRIVADCTMKDTLHWGEGWCWDDDNPTLSPLLVAKKANFLPLLVSELANCGVQLVNVSLSEGETPADATIVCTRTHTIHEVLERIMKDSDNLYAEALFYQIAALEGKRPATAKHARAQMGLLIQDLGLRPKSYRLADGSGLSLYNYLSAELETLLLRYAWQKRKVYYTLLPSLPIAGEDGTLKKRMHSTFTSGNVRAKTGTVTGVSALAGYCTAYNGHELCFSIINQGIMRTATGRNFQDNVCNALCRP